MAASEGGDYLFLKFLICLNAILGLAMFEWAWFSLRRFRNPNLELDAIYPAYRRVDALNWRKWRFYPGAVTLFIPRFLLSLVLVVSMYLWATVLLIG